MDHAFIPDNFYLEEAKVDNRRHFILPHRTDWKPWQKRNDGIRMGHLKLYGPLSHLLTIHAFIKSADAMKQVPLAFILMSGKRKTDYAKVSELLK